jgi:hypothetical protein
MSIERPTAEDARKSQGTLRELKTMISYICDDNAPRSRGLLFHLVAAVDSFLRAVEQVLPKEGDATPCDRAD